MLVLEGNAITAAHRLRGMPPGMCRPAAGPTGLWTPRSRCSPAARRAPRPRCLVMGRRFRVPQAAGGVARFDFAALCGTALGAGDYLALATHFHALVLDSVPRLTPDNFDEARRFIVLIDALYEHRVKLVASAEAAPDALYRSGEGAQAFERTASRL